jgi:hypothetical protein
VSLALAERLATLREQTVAERDAALARYEAKLAALAAYEAASAEFQAAFPELEPPFPGTQPLKFRPGTRRGDGKAANGVLEVGERGVGVDTGDQGHGGSVARGAATCLWCLEPVSVAEINGLGPVHVACIASWRRLMPPPDTDERHPGWVHRMKRRKADLAGRS